MALKFFPVSGFIPARFSAFSVMALLLTVTAAQAGFEWVPSARTAAPPVEMQDENAGRAPAPPAMETWAAEEPSSSFTPLPAEDRGIPVAQDVRPAQVIASQPAIRVKSFGADAGSTPAPAAERVAPPVELSPLAAPAPLAVPPPIAQPVDSAPVVAQTFEAPSPAAVRRVILSDDAPEAARNSVSGGQPLSATSPAPLPPQPQQPAFAEPQAQSPQPVAVAAPPVSAAPADLQRIEGFGTDIPLALALREVVPADYAYSFGDGVNPGYRISWTGGKNWLEVVREMIAPLGLQADISGKVVSIWNPASPIRASSGGVEEKRSDAAAPSVPVAVPAEDNKTTIYSLRRQAITNPGENSASQPPETLEMIENVVSSEMAASVPAPQVEAITPVNAAEIQGQAVASAPETGKLLFWEARKGDSLKRTLDSWSRQANVELVWESSHDYVVNADILMNGDFQRALGKVAASGSQGENAPLFTFVNASEAGKAGKLVVQDGGPSRG